MKKAFFISLFLLISTNMSSQTVMGINVKTTMKKFKPQIAAKGYKPIKTVEGDYDYKVKYAGYPDCTMNVEYNTSNDSIIAVNVFFKHESFNEDQRIYDEITRQFNAKYGNMDETDFDKFGSEFKWSTFGPKRQYFVFWFWNEKKYVYVRYETGVKRQENQTFSPDI